MATEVSLTLKINCHQISDRYTANFRESLYSRYSHVQAKNVPSDGLSIFSEKLHAVRVLLIF